MTASPASQGVERVRADLIYGRSGFVIHDEPPSFPRRSTMSFAADRSVDAFADIKLSNTFA